jgi:hypothetical protein
MKKTSMPNGVGQANPSPKGRILARILAEELANVKVSGAGLTTVATDPQKPGGNKDITNLSGDNDGIEY